MKNQAHDKQLKAVPFEADDFEHLERCPWCDSKSFVPWGNEVRGFQSVSCGECFLIYVKNRLNKNGLNKYYSNYLTNVHQSSSDLVQQRSQMYKLEFNFIAPLLAKGARVLDVGCSGGYFLDLFKENGFDTQGVEFGKEAALEAGKKHTVQEGEFPELAINQKFDLIIFRGVIEHVGKPKDYLNKATSLLADGGLIYITSTPNSDAISCDLFKEQWNQHTPEPHLMHFKARHFDRYFLDIGLVKVKEHFFYEGTPYARPEDDILKMAEAVRLKRNGLSITFRSPAFYGNMMSLVYRKTDCTI